VSSPVALLGSRSLPPSAAPVVAAVLAALGPVPLRVGCCVGADALAVAAALSAGAASRLSLFAAFGPGGVGACSLSSVGGVAAALAAGASVAWWAGGGAAVPLPARLSRRSAAVVAGAALAVAFAPGAGSLSALAVAVRAGCPVLAVAQLAPAPVPGCAGAWSPAPFPGLPAGWACWAWSPAAVQLALGF
jgi:hypothetical protein